MSGGEESVLVIWQLSNSGATRNFLPRLGAPLRHIVSSSADEVTAICHVDNGMSGSFVPDIDIAWNDSVVVCYDSAFALCASVLCINLGLLTVDSWHTYAAWHS